MAVGAGEREIEKCTRGKEGEGGGQLFKSFGEADLCIDRDKERKREMWDSLRKKVDLFIFRDNCSGIVLKGQRRSKKDNAGRKHKTEESECAVPHLTTTVRKKLQELE